jgi:chorismate synthase
MALRYLTAGESHGKGLVGILEGLPSGVPVAVGDVERQLRRRRQGPGRSERQELEDDRVLILSGLAKGRTLGSPVSVLIPNRDARWPEGMPEVTVPRPGHADLAGSIKYRIGLREVMERASARETAMRVALATFCREMLFGLGVSVSSRVLRIGGVSRGWAAEVERARRRGDTLGGVFEVCASGVPVGLGSHVHWDRRLDGRIAAAFMSLNAVKGVEIGLGFSAAALRGGRAHDEYFQGLRRRTNRSGGIDGGMSTGQPVVVRAAMKPLPTLAKPLRSVDLRTGRAARAPAERGDVCAVPAAAVIGESLLCLVLADAVLEKFGGDSMKELRARVR